MKHTWRWIWTGVLLVATAVVVSHFYKTLMLLAVLMLHRRRMSPKLRKGLLLVGLAGLYLTVPKYFDRPWNRVRLVYQERESGRLVKRPKPVGQYLANVLLPESLAANVGTLAFSLRLPKALGMNSTLFDQYLGVNSILLDQYYVDRGIRHSLLRSWRRLEWKGQHTMSGICSQAFNTMGFGPTQSVYVVRPRHYDSRHTYPLVVFCHGSLGNWLGYQSVLQELDSCIVLSIGTRDLSGVFSRVEIDRIFSEQIPFLRDEMGYRIGSVHLIGLSNGGSACHHAYGDRRFASVTFVSTGYDSGRAPHATFYVGGGPENARVASERSRLNGNRSAYLYDPQWNHYLMLRHRKEFIEFMNQNLSRL